MTKKLRQQDLEEMRQFKQQLDNQDRKLEEILLCLKGNSTMNIEGVLPAQKRLESKMDSSVKDVKAYVDTQLGELVKWKADIQKYFDVINSKLFRRLALATVIVFIGAFIYVKGGITAVIKFIGVLFSL